MAITAKPEVLPPGAKARPREGAGAGAGGLFRDENLDMLSHLLDDFIRVPGTPIRFGLDGIVGFIPGLGDVLGGLASSIIILAALVRGLPRATVARMVLNVAIETAAGSLPVVGNLFDIGWRANRRNYALLMEAVHGPGAAAALSRPKTGRSWLFLAGVCLALALLLLIPLVLIGWLVVHGTAAMKAHGITPRL